MSTNVQNKNQKYFLHLTTFSFCPPFLLQISWVFLPKQCPYFFHLQLFPPVCWNHLNIHKPWISISVLISLWHWMSLTATCLVIPFLEFIMIFLQCHSGHSSFVSPSSPCSSPYVSFLAPQASICACLLSLHSFLRWVQLFSMLPLHKLCWLFSTVYICLWFCSAFLLHSWSFWLGTWLPAILSHHPEGVGRPWKS